MYPHAYRHNEMNSVLDIPVHVVMCCQTYAATAMPRQRSTADAQATVHATVQAYPRHQVINSTTTQTPQLPGNGCNEYANTVKNRERHLMLGNLSIS